MPRAKQEVTPGGAFKVEDDYAMPHNREEYRNFRRFDKALKQAQTTDKDALSKNLNLAARIAAGLSSTAGVQHVVWRLCLVSKDSKTQKETAVYAVDTIMRHINKISDDSLVMKYEKHLSPHLVNLFKRALKSDGTRKFLAERFLNKILVNWKARGWFELELGNVVDAVHRSAPTLLRPPILSKTNLMPKQYDSDEDELQEMDMGIGASGIGQDAFPPVMPAFLTGVGVQSSPAGIGGGGLAGNVSCPSTPPLSSQKVYLRGAMTPSIGRASFGASEVLASMPGTPPLGSAMRRIPMTPVGGGVTPSFPAPGFGASGNQQADGIPALPAAALASAPRTPIATYGSGAPMTPAAAIAGAAPRTPVAALGLAAPQTTVAVLGGAVPQTPGVAFGSAVPQTPALALARAGVPQTPAGLAGPASQASGGLHSGAPALLAGAPLGSVVPSTPTAPFALPQTSGAAGRIQVAGPGAFQTQGEVPLGQVPHTPAASSASQTLGGSVPHTPGPGNTPPLSGTFAPFTPRGPTPFAPRASTSASPGAAAPVTPGVGLPVAQLFRAAAGNFQPFTPRGPAAGSLGTHGQPITPGGLTPLTPGGVQPFTPRGPGAILSAGGVQPFTPRGPASLNCGGVSTQPFTPRGPTPLTPSGVQPPSSPGSSTAPITPGVVVPNSPGSSTPNMPGTPEAALPGVALPRTPGVYWGAQSSHPHGDALSGEASASGLRRTSPPEDGDERDPAEKRKALEEAGAAPPTKVLKELTVVKSAPED